MTVMTQSSEAPSYLIVTGGSRGIGAATVELAAKRGYNVAFTYKSNRKAADSVVAAVESAGRRALAEPFDMAHDDPAALYERFDAAGLGRLAGLVNNAGITGPIARLAEVERAVIEEVMQTNVTGLMLCMQQAVRRMSTAQGGAGGCIVNVSSRAGQLGGGGEWIHYAASKGAVDAVTIGGARELGGEGIRVNAVSPGLIDTEIHAAAGAPERLERLVAGVPMGRAGTAEEVAEAILWLLSPASAYVSGAVVPISGAR